MIGRGTSWGQRTHLKLGNSCTITYLCGFASIIEGKCRCTCRNIVHKNNDWMAIDTGQTIREFHYWVVWLDSSSKRISRVRSNLKLEAWSSESVVTVVLFPRRTPTPWISPYLPLWETTRPPVFKVRDSQGGRYLRAVVACQWIVLCLYVLYSQARNYNFSESQECHQHTTQLRRQVRCGVKSRNTYTPLAQKNSR